MKILFRIVLVLVLLAVVAVGAAFFFADQIIAAGLKKGLEDAAGTEVTLGDTDLDLGSTTRLAVTRLQIANPPDFAGGDVLAVTTFSTEIDVPSMVSSAPRIKSVLIDGVTLRPEAKGTRLNLLELQKHLASKSGSDDPSATQPTKDKRRYRVDRVSITNIHVSPVGSLATLMSEDLRIPDIELTDLEGTPEQINAQVLGQLIKQTLSAVPNADQVLSKFQSAAESLGTKGLDEVKKQGSEALKDVLQGAGSGGSEDGSGKPKINLDVDMGGLNGAIEGMIPGSRKPKPEAGGAATPATRPAADAGLGLNALVC